MTETDIRTVVVERDMPFPAERVWRALTSPHLVSEWLMKTDFVLGRGEKFRLSGDWGGVDCEFLAIEPHTRLSYRWDHAHEDPAYALKSVVTFTLTETEVGTHVRMEQTGFRADQKQALGGAQYGWTEHLANLEKAVAALD
ncbi:SRPBCC family protein [Pelagibacterium sediminicola]|uniref:SRPBCC family protein n=1 Tax=Pelagibacterium sediminicola TaxID=2248761 RepID=UPI000E316BC4|nr:SRPBCC domain-containing protein [Pelagibacterium sediminicola]